MEKFAKSLGVGAMVALIWFVLDLIVSVFYEPAPKDYALVVLAAAAGYWVSLP